MSITDPASHLELAVGHLNTPVGQQLTSAQLREALFSGSSACMAPLQSALLRYLFVELEPRLIVQCAYEAGSDVARANLLYQESLQHAMPRVPAWERAIEVLL